MNNMTALKELYNQYLTRERNRKIELVAAITLWLIGCPILCSIPQTSSGTLWSTPDKFVCGLPQYSISSSMTGHYPKIWGSIFATLFAVLIQQRTSNGLCPALKLGWLVRFSPLVEAAGTRSKDEKQRLLDQSCELESDHFISRELYKRIQRIETLGYIAGTCLVALVILDAKYFTVTHIILAQIAFTALYRQDWSVGTLGRDFPSLFPNWTSNHGKIFFYLGVNHFAMMMILISILQTTWNRGHCDAFHAMMESISMKVSVDSDTLKWLLAVYIWYCEYAFGLCCIYIQLLEHYEVQLWNFVGDKNMVYLEANSTYSIFEVLQRVFGSSHKTNEEIDILLGSSKDEGTAKTLPKQGHLIEYLTCCRC